jgi:hypothetical protein
MIAEIIYYCRKSLIRERRAGYVAGGRNYSVLLVSGIPFSLPHMRMRRRLKKIHTNFPNYAYVYSG